MVCEIFTINSAVALRWGRLCFSEVSGFSVVSGALGWSHPLRSPLYCRGLWLQAGHGVQVVNMVFLF